jgi:hypothetical protein
MRTRSVILVVAAASFGLSLAAPAGATRGTGAPIHSATSVLSDVKAFGDATFSGSTNSVTFNQPIVGVEGTTSTRGYWEVASDGGVFTFGDAKFFGSMGRVHLNQPIVGIAATPSASGYWLVASDGGVFAFGDAKYRGSMGGTPLSQPVVGIARASVGVGYWLVASDGGVFTFGTAKFFGSLGGEPLDQTVAITGIAARPAGDGYWMADADGRVFPFGRAAGLGNAAASDLSMPVVAIASTPSGRGFWLAGRGASAAAPEQVAEPGCAPNGSQRAVRPTFFLLACADGNSRIENATWSVWAGDHASGTGTFTENDCVPDCALGHFHSETADLTLEQPVLFHGYLVFSQLRVHLHGPFAPFTTTTVTFTLV